MSADVLTAPAPAGARPVEYASFGRRLGAALLDSLVLIIGLVWLLGGALLTLALLIIGLSFYFQFCEKRWGQTIGKNATGIRVLSLDGSELSWNQTAWRNLLRLVDLPLAMVGADYLIVRSSERHQRLGDRVAKTIVVRERAPEVQPPAQQQAHQREGNLVSAPPPQPPQEAPASPTSADLFGEATEALAQHPAASSGSDPSNPGGDAPAADGSSFQWTAPAGGVGVFPDVTWGPGTALLGVLGALFGAAILAIPVLVLDPHAGSNDGSVAGNIVVQLIQAAVLIGVPLAIAARKGGREALRTGLDRLGVKGFAPSAFGWMALAVGAYIVIAIVSYALLHPTQQKIAQDFGAVPFQILLVVIAAPISEEICFRGFLFGGLRTRMPAIAAALASGALFGALHAPTGVGAVPQLFALGAILALLYDKTGSIVPGLMLHMLNNALALIAS